MTADVTMIVTTYDRPAWLAVSLNAIKASAAFAALRGIETRILVVDDASPGDGTRDVARALGADYLRNPVNDGRNDPAVARSIGVQAVDSPYFAFFDDDDFMLPRWIRLHVEAMERGVDVCSTAHVRTDAEFVPIRSVVPEVATMGDLLVGRIAVGTHSLIRTDVVRDVPWETEWENVMELQVWLELMFRGHRFDRLVEPTFLYRRHGDNMSDRMRSDPRDAELRRLMIDRYRAKVLERDGVLPEPSAPTTSPAQRRPSGPARRAARRLKRFVVQRR